MNRGRIRTRTVYPWITFCHRKFVSDALGYVSQSRLVSFRSLSPLRPRFSPRFFVYPFHPPFFFCFTFPLSLFFALWRRRSVINGDPVQRTRHYIMLPFRTRLGLRIVCSPTVARKIASRNTKRNKQKTRIATSRTKRNSRKKNRGGLTSYSVVRELVPRDVILMSPVVSDIIGEIRLGRLVSADS